MNQTSEHTYIIMWQQNSEDGGFMQGFIFKKAECKEGAITDFLQSNDKVTKMIITSLEHCYKVPIDFYRESYLK